MPWPCSSLGKPESGTVLLCKLSGRAESRVPEAPAGVLLLLLLGCRNLSEISAQTPVRVEERRHHWWTKATTAPERPRYHAQSVFPLTALKPQGGTIK